MTVIATLVVGRDGSTSMEGNSRGISSEVDRRRFLHLHSQAEAIVIGSQTALSDPYLTQKCPVYVFTRKPDKSFGEQFTPVVVTDGSSLKDAMSVIQARHSGLILVESGPQLMMSLIRIGAIDELCLSITPVTGGTNNIDVDELLSNFVITTDITEEDTRLLQGRYKSDATNG